MRCISLNVQLGDHLEMTKQLLSEITMKMNTYMTYTDELFAVRPATWIEKSNSGFMLKCKKVVQFKNT